MRIVASDINLGNFSFLSKKNNSNGTADNTTGQTEEDWVRVNWILGGEPYLTFETNEKKDLDDYQAYMSQSFPELKFNRISNGKNRTTLIGTSEKTKCNELMPPGVNFTFNTSKEHQFHISPRNLMFDSYMNMNMEHCVWAVIMVHDPIYEQKALLMGEPFFKTFNVSIDYDNQVVGIQGHRTDVVVPP
jgi:hypothetical protein